MRRFFYCLKTLHIHDVSKATVFYRRLRKIEAESSSFQNVINACSVCSVQEKVVLLTSDVLQIAPFSRNSVGQISMDYLARKCFENFRFRFCDCGRIHGEKF